MYFYEEEFDVFISDKKLLELWSFNFKFTEPGYIVVDEYIHGKKIRGKTKLTFKRDQDTIITYSVISPEEGTWSAHRGVSSAFSRCMEKISNKEAKDQIGLAFAKFIKMIKEEYADELFDSI